MTSVSTKYNSAFSRRDASELLQEWFAQQNRGRRECRALDAPAASRAKLNKAHERSHHRFRRINRHSPRNGFNGLYRALPGERIRLVTVIRGLKVCQSPVGPT